MRSDDGTRATGLEEEAPSHVGLLKEIHAWLQANSLDLLRDAESWFGFVEKDERPFFLAWACFHYAQRSRTIAGRFMTDRGSSLPHLWKRWLDAERATELSIWQVQGRDADGKLALRDLLGTAMRLVPAPAGIGTLAATHSMLARVIDGPGGPVIGGAHPRMLQSDATNWVIRCLRIHGVVRPNGWALRTDPEDVLMIADVWREAASYVHAGSPLPPPR